MQAIPTSVRANSNPAGTVSILLIENDDRERDYYATRLRLCSSDYVVYEAANGKTGLDFYRSRAIDCVILELELADISGLEVRRDRRRAVC